MFFILNKSEDVKYRRGVLLAELKWVYYSSQGIFKFCVCLKKIYDQKYFP